MAAQPLEVSLLGRPAFAVGGDPVTFASRKALALFAYLLLERRLHARRDVAVLFWGARDVDAARANLRLTLHRLPAAAAACLTVDRESVGIAPGARLDCDIDRFDALARDDRLVSLDAAAAMYRDGLVKDLAADATPEFDDWLHAARVHWEQRAQAVFDRVIALRTEYATRDAARAAAEREAAMGLALRWAGLMPGAESAHRWLMRLYIDLGQRDAAIAQFELCQRFLAVTHGRAPALATRALYDEAVAARAPTVGSGAAPQVPAATAGAEAVARDGAPSFARPALAGTSFVGRLEELAQLGRLLEDPAARLITLHGLGGAGKTRLADALAHQVSARFADGVVWVALDALVSADALPAAIARALGRELPARGDRAEAVATMLARGEHLLVLDNLETLLAAPAPAADAEPRGVVLAILAAAKRTRILVTSREVLGLQEEWVYEVRGLPYAVEGANAGALAPAVELFRERARQAYLGFSLEAELPHVERICSLVEGLPLAIEIAAAWVRTVPAGEIAAAVEREAQKLSSVHRNRPQRQQSLEAVIQYSWQLLADEQREALAGLGLFVGGFTRDAAAQVAQAPLRTLSALVDKALVRRRTEGRYDLHELVRQFALARLQGMRALHKAALQRYIAHYRDAVLAIYAQSRGPDEAGANVTLRAELQNVLSCLRHCVSGDRVEVVAAVAAPLVTLLHTHGLMHDALAVAEETTRVLDGRVRDEIVGQLRLQWGRAAITGGRPDVAREQLERAVAASAHGHPDAAARCLYFRGAYHYSQGDVAAARRDGEAAARLAAGTTDHELRSLVCNIQGTVANVDARFADAERHLREGLAAARAQGIPSNIAVLLCGLAVPLYYQGRLAEAAELTREAAVLSEALGKISNAIFARGNLAAIELALGALEPARREAEAAARLARQGGQDSALAGCLATLGEILLRSGRIADARAAATEAAHVAEVTGNALQRMHALYVLATAALRDGRAEDALGYLQAFAAALAARRIDVRVPMLILAAADLALLQGGAARVDGVRWLRAVAGAPDVEDSLRASARAMLERVRVAPAAAVAPDDAHADDVRALPVAAAAQAGVEDDAPAERGGAAPAAAALAAAEAEVTAFLARPAG